MKVSDYKLVEDLRGSFDNFISVINESITEYESSKKSSDTEEVQDWKTRVLGNLDEYNTELEAAIESYDAGDSSDLQGISSMIRALPKDLENFESDWMSSLNKANFDKGLSKTTKLAYQIEMELYSD